MTHILKLEQREKELLEEREKLLKERDELLRKVEADKEIGIRALVAEAQSRDTKGFEKVPSPYIPYRENAQRRIESNVKTLALIEEDFNGTMGTMARKA